MKLELYEDTLSKKVTDFPVPSRDVTNQTLPGREKLNYSRPGRVWLVTSRLGTGKPLTFYYSVHTNQNIRKKSCETIGSPLGK
jgi:hypothetical protein